MQMYKYVNVNMAEIKKPSLFWDDFLLTNP